ncbi:leukocyte immunoglobulin-like receptor subfamily A member 1 [Mustelus asterias]
MSLCCVKASLWVVSLSMLLLIVPSLIENSEGNPLPKPTLSLDPSSGAILPGEEVSLTCHFPFIGCAGEFYRNDNDLVSYFNEENYNVTHQFKEGLPAKGHNSYTCQYRKYFENNRTWGYSPRSDPVWVTVTDKLPEPTLSIEPASGVVTVGERVQFNCTSSYPAHISHLYKKQSRSPIDSRKVSDSERTVILTLADLVPEDSKEYSCSFEKTVNGRVYHSDRSAFVEVTVKEELPKADISVDPPSGVVSRGEAIRINCVGSILAHGGRFHLHREDEEDRTLDVPGPQQSANFTIRDTNTTGTWNYSCSYGRMVKGREYHSPRSDGVRVTVKQFSSTSKTFTIRLCLGILVLFGIVVILGIEFKLFKRKKDGNGAVDEGLYSNVRDKEETTV